MIKATTVLVPAALVHVVVVSTQYPHDNPIQSIPFVPQIVIAVATAVQLRAANEHTTVVMVVLITERRER